MAIVPKPPNDLLREARRRCSSPSGSQRPLSRAELAAAANRVLADRHSAPGSLVHPPVLTAQYIGALERGEIRWPNRAYREALCVALSATETELGLYIDRPERQRPTKSNRESGPKEILVTQRLDLPTQLGHGHARPMTQLTDGLFTLAAQPDRETDITDELMDLMAHRSLADSVEATAGFDRVSLSDLFEDLRESAVAYGSHDRRRTVALGLVRLQELRRLAKGHLRRADRDDVYLLLSLTNALLASAAFDLSRWQAAMAFARAARGYARESGSPAALGWACGLLATFLNWNRRPADALVVIDGVISAVGLGSPVLHRLYHIAARSRAQLDDLQGARDALRRAHEVEAAPNTRRDLLSAELGGEFIFGPARAEACAGAVWLDLGEAAEAERALRRAIDLCSREGHRTEETALFGGARFDLASAMVLRGDFEAAAEALEKVWDLPTHHRVSVVAGRATALQRRLQTDAWSRDRRAAALHAQASEWIKSATPSI